MMAMVSVGVWECCVMRKALSLAMGALDVLQQGVRVSPQSKILDPDEEERRDQAKGAALVLVVCATTLSTVAFAFLAFVE